ncbi:hypothetical protein [Microbacterium paulum]
MKLPQDRLNELLADPDYCAILVNALADYALQLRFHFERADDVEAAHLQRSILRVEDLSMVFDDWS